uniref:Uncharacterized protein n=1 Tax=Opuntia streptacantha TaxID=393608 RepID=A0A7C9CXL5_OPUST
MLSHSTVLGSLGVVSFFSISPHLVSSLDCLHETTSSGFLSLFSFMLSPDPLLLPTSFIFCSCELPFPRAPDKCLFWVTQSSVVPGGTSDGLRQPGFTGEPTPPALGESDQNLRPEGSLSSLKLPGGFVIGDASSLFSHSASGDKSSLFSET